jgi:AcrR family transcriptional regulator
MSPKRDISRNRANTKRKILEAYGRLVSRLGFHAVGINAVANEAGVDKVLIYRYFGGMEGLANTFAQSGEGWPTLEQLLGTNMLGAADLQADDLARRFLSNLIHELRARPVAQEILRAELFEQNEITKTLTAARERTLGALQLLEDAGHENAYVISNVLVAGIIHLLLMSKARTSFGELDLTKDETWQRIEQASLFALQKLLSE